MKRPLGAIVLAALAAGVVYGYVVTQRERSYREFMERGDAALARDDSYAAIEAFSVAIWNKADSMAAHLKRGEAYRRRGEFGEALRDLRRAADIDPGSPYPRELLGDVQYALAERERDFAPVRFARAVERYAECLQLDDSSARVQYKLGLSAYRAGQLPLAISALQAATRLDDRFAEAHYLLGVCLRARGQPRDAVQALQRAVRLSPAFLAAREELADVFGALGRQTERISQLNALLTLEPTAARERTLGVAYARAGQLDLAVTQLGRAVQKYPDDGALYLALGRLWLDRADAGDGVELKKALHALGSAVNNDSTSETLTLYGRALLRNGEVARAERTLQLAATRFPVDPDAFLYLADAASRLGRTAVAHQAWIDYGALVRVETLPTWVLVRLADAQVTAGRLVEARRTIESALEKDPSNARALRLLKRLQ